MALDPTIELTPEGNVVAEKFFGDGSGITNLDVSGNLNFLGEADFTQPLSGQAFRNTFSNGDFGINTKTGAPDPSWEGLETVEKVNAGNFMYYSTASSSNGWYVGYNNAEGGFMTVSTEQLITSEKTYEVPQTFKSEIGLEKQSKIRIDVLEFIGNVSTP